MKKNLLVMVGALVLSILFFGVGQVMAASLVFDDTVLKVGIDNSGGLVNLGAGQGITYKPGPLPNDFTLPGTPWEFYSIGAGGATIVQGVNGAASNPIGVTTIDKSVAGFFAAHTNGAIFSLGGATLSYDQTVSFVAGSNVIHFKADLFNVGSIAATGVVYARGLDPDQDVLKFGHFETNNYILGPSSVLAIGPLTKLAVQIDALNGSGSKIPGVASIADAGWTTNPYTLALGGLLGGAIAGNPFDYSINMAWLIGDIAPGGSVELDWTYTFSTVPEPGILILLGIGLSAVGVLSRRIKL